MVGGYPGSIAGWDTFLPACPNCPPRVRYTSRICLPVYPRVRYTSLCGPPNHPFHCWARYEAQRASRPLRASQDPHILDKKEQGRGGWNLLILLFLVKTVRNVTLSAPFVQNVPINQ